MKKFFPQLSRKILIFLFLLFFGFFSLFCLKDRLFPSWDTRFEDFTNELFCQELSANTLNLHYTLAYPEKYQIKDYGISLGSMNPKKMQENFASVKALKKQLEKYPFSKLSPENQQLFDMLRLHLATELSCEDCYMLQEPLGPNLGVQAQLPILLAEYTFRRDYLSLLCTLPDYFSEILSFEKEKSHQGLFMSDTSTDRIIQQCRDFCKNQSSHYLSETFTERITELQNKKLINKKQANSYIKTHKKILKKYVFPSYQALAEGLEGLKGTGKNENGLAHLPNGKNYYLYLVKSSTGDYRPIKEIQQNLYRQLFSDFEEIQKLVQKDPDIFTQAARLPQTSSYSPEQMLDYLSRIMTDDFPALTITDYKVKYVPASMEKFSSPAFYLTPPVDTLTPNTIYINQSSTVSCTELFTTLAHEGFPGHLYQTVFFGKQYCPPARHLLGCSGYTEGWATYVEDMSYRYASDFLKTDPEVMEFLRLNRSVTLCLYSILDTGIHYTGWNLATVQKLLEGFGITEAASCQEIFQYIVENPSNYLKYYLGFLNFHALRNSVQEIQGEDFNLKTFHQNLLEIGSAPFPVVKKYLLMKY